MRKLGDYAIESQIGAGGMGVVLRARAPAGRAVAIKVVQRPSEEAAARFERERRLLASFGMEQGFVPLIDAGEAPQGPYIVMPLLEGGTLRDRLAGGAPLSVEATLAIARRVVSAVALAHEHGVVHRDLKPENVLFTKEGDPLVADLGLAKHFRRDDPGGSKSLTLTGAGEFKGTVCYMAPEQMADARAAGPPADVFSLGAILYECLAGHPAFGGSDVLDVINAVNTGSHVPLGRARPDVPRWLEAAIEKSLAPRAASRTRPGSGARSAAERAPGGSGPRSASPSSPRSRSACSEWPPSPRAPARRARRRGRLRRSSRRRLLRLRPSRPGRRPRRSRSSATRSSTPGTSRA